MSLVPLLTFTEVIITGTDAWSHNPWKLSADCKPRYAGLKHITDNSKFPIDIKSYVLIAATDGYWQGKSVSEIENHLNKYLANKEVIYKKASHLWVLMPENITETLSLMKK